MKRRLMLKQVMMAAAVVALGPSCTTDRKKVSLALTHLKVDGDQEELLAAVVDTIIPATDIPGARALNVHRFVLKMIDDCYDENTQDQIVKGLDQIMELSKKQFGKSFADGSMAEREGLLRNIQDKGTSIPSEIGAAFPVIKQLTIQGFMTTQYVMENIQGYEMAPGRFHGCVDVQSKMKSA